MAYLMSCVNLEVLPIPGKLIIQSFEPNTKRAFSYLKSCRGEVNPNDGFIDQINTWKYKIDPDENEEMDEYIRKQDENCLLDLDSFLPKITLEINFLDKVKKNIEVKF